MRADVAPPRCRPTCRCRRAEASIGGGFSHRVIISVLNQKGGVGKTTTTLHSGAALAVTGAKILLADLDLQRDLAAYESPLDAPSVTFAATEAAALSALFKREQFDFALLDCVPSLGKKPARRCELPTSLWCRWPLNFPLCAAWRACSKSSARRRKSTASCKHRFR